MANLTAIGDGPVILTPSRLLRVAKQIRTGDVVMVADFGAPHAAEETLCGFMQAPSRLYASS